MSTKLHQFSYLLKGHEWYGIAEIQTIETLPVIVTVTDLYLDGYMDENPPDMKDIVDYQLVLDIEDMIRIEFENM